MHFKVSDKGVPVSCRTEAGPRTQIHSGKAECRGNESGCSLTVRTKGLSVDEERCVKLARSPALQDHSGGCVIDSQQISDDGKIGSKRHDCANVEVAIGPAIEPAPNPGSKGIVDRRVAQGALNSDRLELSIRTKNACDAHHGIQFQEGQGGGRIVEVRLLSVRDHRAEAQEGHRRLPLDRRPVQSPDLLPNLHRPVWRRQSPDGV